MAGAVTPPTPSDDDPREQALDRLHDGLDRPRLTVALAASLVLIHAGIGARVLLRGNAGVWEAFFAGRGERLLRRSGAMWWRAVDRGELWRLVTSVFLHGDALHLLVNTSALFALGRLCEAVYGPSRMLWIFLLSGVGGATLTWVGGTTLTVGASGGIFGLLGAAFVFGWKQGRALPDDTAAFFRRRLVPWILVNLAIGLLLPFIDNLGHIGGLVTGCLLGMVLDNRVTERPSRSIGVLLAGLSLSLLTIGLWGVSTKWR